MAEKAQADQGGPFKEFVFEEWLRDGFEGICDGIKHRRAHLDISDFRTHMRNARKEQLLAVRSLVDSTIEMLEKSEKQDKA